MAIRILATGDIHIGKRPSRVSEADLSERASAARMWEAIASLAVSQQVDAVLLSGDIVDHNNCFHEATGPLERGILRLADAGIPTYAVAGNHDWNVFPRILDQLDNPLFYFLGAGGVWEETHLERDGEPLLRIVGWSFPAQHVRHNPLKDFPDLSVSEAPTVGLFHADVDNPKSPYAPVRLSELQSRNLTMWLLGHDHKPQHWLSDTGTAVLYPGSPQALSPAERGTHGPWLIELGNPGPAEFRQLPMSLVRYEDREVDLTGAANDESFDARINEAVTSVLEEVAADAAQAPNSPELLVLKLNLTGSTPLCGRVNTLARPLEELDRHRGNIQARIDRCVNLTRPAVDLEELSRGNDPAGTLARTLIALERNEINDALSALLSDAVSRLRATHQASAYAALHAHDPPPDREMARQLLLQQGRLLLEALRSQLPETEEEPE